MNSAILFDMLAIAKVRMPMDGRHSNVVEQIKCLMPDFRVQKGYSTNHYNTCRVKEIIIFDDKLYRTIDKLTIINANKQ